MREWNYLFHLRTSGSDYKTCQYMVRYDDTPLVIGAWWRTPECAALANPPAVTPIPVVPLRRARANLTAAQAQAREARAYYNRLLPLKGQNYVAAADLDRARAAAGNADGQVAATRAALDELLHGTRPEQLAQAQAAVAAAQAQVDAQQVLLGKLAVVAPRAGRIDSLPYRLGDQAPVGAPLAVLLVGEAPHARVYVPETLRAQVAVGGGATVKVGADGARNFQGRVRMVRSEPVFTPYYALTGKDAARLSYLAEVQLEGQGVGELPAGLPVRVEFDAR